MLGFVYGLVLGSFNGKRDIKMIDAQAEQAQKFQQVLAQTGRIWFMQAS